MQVRWVKKAKVWPDLIHFEIVKWLDTGCCRFKFMTFLCQEWKIPTGDTDTLDWT